MPYVFNELSTNAGGLSSDEAKRRLKELGPNTFEVASRISIFRRLLDRVLNPLVLILITASVISAITGEILGFLIIVTMVFISVMLDVYQEYKADKSAEKLKERISVSVSVLRDGEVRVVKAADLVQGDVVMLSAGDMVPADGMIIECCDFFVNQSQLTGEPYPVEKHKEQLALVGADSSLPTNAVFMGSGVVSGSAKILIIKTGSLTQMGAISRRLIERALPTAFEDGIRRFGILIMRITVLLVLFVLMVNAAFGRPLFETFLFAVALAVGLTPELLPMVISVTLSRGAIRMAEKSVIVKKLSAIHNLGAMDVLCMDKTGTLTESKISLTKHLDTLGNASEHVLNLAYLNSFFESGLKSPLDDAILGHHYVDTSGWKKVDEVPFDFERRRVSVLLENSGKRMLILKGAPEDVISSCRRYERSGIADVQDLNEKALMILKERCDELQSQGLRVLGIAWREVRLDHPHALVSDETDLIFSGFAVFIDPPKKGVALALSALNQNGIDLKIVTGDSEEVTRHLCEQLGLPVKGAITGSEISHMDKTALQARVESANIFCRVNPAQKERIILALRSKGHVVGYLGDGINDAPSIHSADVGFSVDTAVDVAKSAADIILLSKDLSVLNTGVTEGRRTFVNVMKYIQMGTSSNFGNMFSMAGAAVFLPFLPMLPTQILLNNMLYDLSEVAIPMDYVDANAVAAPCKWDLHLLRNFMITMGSLSSCFDFLTFHVLYKILNANQDAFRTGWFIESLATQVLVIFVIRTRSSPLKSKPHRLLILSSLLVVAIGVLFPFFKISSVFGFIRPESFTLMILAVIAFCYLLSAEFIKRIFYRTYFSSKT